MGNIEHRDPEAVAFEAAALRDYKSHGKHGLAEFVAAYAAGWIAHREHHQGAVEALRTIAEAEAWPPSLRDKPYVVEMRRVARDAANRAGGQ
jgi:hypothetical protein